MGGKAPRMMHAEDAFADLARYYDPIMDHVDYARWFAITGALADLVPSKTFTHLDVACGTGVLIKELAQQGWTTMGIDLSAAMLRAGRKGSPVPVTAQADMGALPFRGCFDFATCLFDSLNFLLDPQHLARAFRQIAEALNHEGLLYFDIITERMVTEYFEDQKWEEKNGRFTTTWEGAYDRASSVATTAIRVKSGPTAVVRERVYGLDEIETAVRGAGLSLLATVDAQTWKKPTRKTVRIDCVAVKEDSKEIRKAFRRTQQHIRDLL